MPQGVGESAFPHGSEEQDAETSADGAPIQNPEYPSKNRLRYFGDYELIEEIARGGMGVVYKAVQVSLNRVVAVKMILAGQLASEADVKRFHTEAEAAANLQHPNIVGIYEVGEQNGQHYFSMNYVEGRSLAESIRTTPVSAQEAAAIVRTLATAIQYAHQRGILHRDLKPQNVIMDAQGQPHITDFGLAKRLELDGGLTQSGAVLGSPSYMSPEQASGRQDLLGPASDVYSLGAILYELLTGRTPFRGETPMATLAKVRLEEPIAPTKLDSKTPADLETLCLKCLEKQPERRFASARLLAEELERFLNHEPILTRPATRTRKTWNWFQRHPWTIAAILTVLILGVTSLAYGLWQQLHYLKWTADHPNEVPHKGLDWLLLTFFFSCWSLTFLGTRSELKFRRDYRERKLKGLAMQPWKLACRGMLGLSILYWGLLLVLKGIETMIWHGDPVSSGAALYIGFAACWMGAAAGWAVLGLVKGSVFESLVQKSFDRGDDKLVRFRRYLKDGKVPPELQHVLTAACWVVGVWLAFGTIRAVRDQWELEDHRNTLLANPPKLSWREPNRLKVSDELNFAKTPLVEAIAYQKRVDTNVWSDLKSLNRTPKNPMIGINDGWRDLWKGWETTLEGLAAFASSTSNPPVGAGRANQPALALFHHWEPQVTELRQASKRPYARFELEIPVGQRYSNPSALRVEWTNAPNFTGLHTLARLSFAHGVAGLLDGSPEDAVADAAIIFKLTDCLSESSKLEFSGAWMNAYAVGLFWEGFVKHLWLKEHLSIFQNQFQSIDLIGDVDAAFRAGDWIQTLNVMDRRATFTQLGGPLFSGLLRGGVLEHQWMEDFVLSSYDIKQGLIFPKKTEANGTAYELDSRRFYERRKMVLPGMYLGYFPRMLRNVAHCQTTIHLATLACALERHQKSKGRYPERLEELMPEFIQKVPHEVVNGKPFQYRRLEDGAFTLYSVGWDEHDDSGVASTEKNGKETGDWVWFYAPVEPK